MGEKETALIEIAQDITITAWDKLYGKPGYDDSRMVLELFRQWTVEFNEWWENEAIYDNDIVYMLAVEEFANRKVEECLLRIPSSPILHFSVDVIRTSSCTKTFTVEARNKEEAKNVALAMAHDSSFDEDTAEYTVGNVLLT